MTYPFYSSSKSLRPPSSPGVFGTLQSFREDKAKPVRDEYEYVSDDGELKIDEFPIRRKKSAPKRDLSCEAGGCGQGVPSGLGLPLEGLHLTLVYCAFSLVRQEGSSPPPHRDAKAGLRGIQGEVSAAHFCLVCKDIPPSCCPWAGLRCGVGIRGSWSCSVPGTRARSCPWEINQSLFPGIGLSGSGWFP